MFIIKLRKGWGRMKREIGEKRQKNIVQKAKKIRSMVMMSLLCILMLSAATYAWFSLSNTAKVSNLTMTVGDVTGLQIAEDNGQTPSDGDWGSSIDGGVIYGKLLPATTKDGIKMESPVYNDSNGAVKGTTEEQDGVQAKKLTKEILEADKDTEGYWIERTFYLRASGAADGTTKVKLADGEGVGATGIWSDSGSYNGTYVLSKGVTGTEILPGAAVRISFQKDGASTATVFEPNVDFNTVAQKKASNERNKNDKKIISSTVTETMSGTCTFPSGKDNILVLENNKATKIIMRIWIEGEDPQCGNEISAKDIVTQLKFVTVE